MTDRSRVMQTLKEKGNKAAGEVAERVIAKKTLLPQVIDGVCGPGKRLTNASAKTLKIISERSPGCLYPHFNFFVDLLAKDGQ